MKRTEMVKKLAIYMYDCNEARASDTLRFLEDEGMGMTEYLQGAYPSAVGWDPEESKDNIKIPTLLYQVQDHMNWTDLQARQWYFQPNPLLGGLAPNDFITQGRGDKLLKWIHNQIDESSPVVKKDKRKKRLTKKLK